MTKILNILLIINYSVERKKEKYFSIPNSRGEREVGEEKSYQKKKHKKNSNETKFESERVEGDGEERGEGERILLAACGWVSRAESHPQI